MDRPTLTGFKFGFGMTLGAVSALALAALVYGSVVGSGGDNLNTSFERLDTKLGAPNR